MDAYQDFAYVYDELMDTTPYGEWCELICGLIEKYGVSRSLVTVVLILWSVISFSDVSEFLYFNF